MQGVENLERFLVKVTGKGENKISEKTLEKEKIFFMLEEEDLSRALTYLYKKSTEEVKRYIDPKKIEKISVEEDGVLFHKGRVLDEQTLRCIADLEDVIDIKSLVGFNFRVPLIYQNLPLALLLPICVSCNRLQANICDAHMTLLRLYIGILIRIDRSRRDQ